MSLDASVGGVGSNSYVSLADAEIFFELRSYSSSWTSASDEVKDSALVQATRMADGAYDYLGTISTQEQALRWPRSGVYDQDGRVYADDQLPKALTDAICDLALYITQADLQADDSADLIEELEVGPIKLEFDKSREKVSVPQFVHDQLILLSVAKNSSRYGPFGLPVIRS